MTAAPPNRAPTDALGLWFALPAAVVYLPLVFLPLAYSLTLSLFRWNGLAAEWTWVGLGNYQAMVGDTVFWRALGHNLLLVAASLGLQLPVALGLALVLGRSGRLLAVVRTSVFMPYVLPTVVIALVWRLLAEAACPAVLGSTTWSLPLVIGVVSWRFVGFHTVLYLAGLAAIDPRLYEAARLDGAGAWARFRHLTLPLLKPVLTVSATLAVVGAMKYFDVVFVMTGGGPAQSTELLATYMYKQGFSAARLGYASALAVTIVVLALAGMAAVLLVTRRGGAGAEDRP